MGKKIALLIGVGEYGNGLKPLQCPANGVHAMQALLENSDIGGFDEVVPLINPDVGTMQARIGSVFGQLTKQDLVLFYFTGHGIKDMAGKFYLSTKQTEKFENETLNPGTAVSADFVKGVIGNSLAQRKVVILDCCFGAAFAKGFLGMDDSSIDVAAQLGGKGWCVLTASTSTKYALEQEGEDLSVYTRYLVEGLKTGGAAPEGKESISIGNLHQYLYTQVKAAASAMEPTIFNAKQGSDIVIAKVRLDNSQRYRKQVQAKTKNIRISVLSKLAIKGNYWALVDVIRPTAFRNLNLLQEKLGLTEEIAKDIQEEFLKPYRDKTNNLAKYTEILREEKAYGYPLDEDAIQELEESKRLLNLLDEDVQAIEQEILGHPVKQQPSGKIKEHKSQKSSTPLPNLTYKDLAQEDISEILYMKNVKATNGWAYNLEHINEIEGSTNSRTFELFWSESSKGAKTPSAGELVILHQRAKVTHIVQILDDNAYTNEEGTWRWVRALWMPSPQTDWSQLPHQREILGFDPPTIVGGATLSFQSKNFSNFWKAWEKIEEFQSYVWLKLNGQTTLSAAEYQAQAQLGPQYSTFSFETVKVDNTGNVIETDQSETKYFAEDLGNGITLDMVRIPGGRFMMGAAEREAGASDDEYPQHEVTIPEFWMGKFAVTQAQWQAVAELKKIERDLESDPARFKGAKRPIERVTWQEAEEFCKRLSQKFSKEYTLPSEAQWEYACRAGTKTPFHFGPTITTNLANYQGTDWTYNNKTYPGNYGNGPKGEYREETTEVGSFAIANSFGLYDMHGNVWEWCLDAWHDTYKDAPKDGSARISSEKTKILRGGSWDNLPVSCRSANRGRDAFDPRFLSIGFRVVCFPPRT